MTAENEVLDGDQIAFAYNAANGNPWHGMGTPLKGYATLEEMLEASHCDREVTLEPLYVTLEGGTRLVVPDKRAAVLRGKTIATPDPTVGIRTITIPDKIVGVHSDNYNSHQHRDVGALAEVALDIYNSTSDGAHWDTMGMLCDGAVFFASLILPDGVIDPMGIADKVERRFTVLTSHNGTLPTQAGGNAIRPVCNNTLTAARHGMKRGGTRMFSIKHTSRSEDRIKTMIAAVDNERDWWTHFTEQAEALLRVQDNPNSDTFRQVLDQFVPLPDELGRGLTLAENKRNDLWQIYTSDTNAGRFGKNGWSIYNTFAEYVDWSLPVRGAGTDANARMALRMEQQLLGTQEATKVKVAEYLLAGVA
jgi:phage/plasmid-like protein (TIGR03299 family)